MNIRGGDKRTMWAERPFLDGFSNLRCEMVGWGFEFLILKLILVFQLRACSNIESKSTNNTYLNIVETLFRLD